MPVPSRRSILRSGLATGDFFGLACQLFYRKSPGAQQRPAEADGKTEEPRIATVNLDALYHRSTKVKAQSDALRQDAMERKRALLKTAKDVERQMGLLKEMEPGNDREQAEAKLKTLQQEFESARKQAESWFSRRELKAISDIQKAISAIVAAIAKQCDLSLVLNVNDEPADVKDPQSMQKIPSSAVLFSTPDLDITNEVLERLDRLP